MKEAMGELQETHTNSFFLTAGADLNKTSVKSVLPKVYQHVKCATRSKNTLHLV